MSDLMPWMAPWSGRVTALAFFAIGAWLVILGLRRRRNAIAGRYCPACDYNLAGLEGRDCPECGHKPTDATPIRVRIRRIDLVIIGILIAFVLPTFTVYRRVSQYGWEYYLRYGPGYWLFGQVTTEELHEGPYIIRVSWDRRDVRKNEFVEVFYHGALVYHSDDDDAASWQLTIARHMRIAQFLGSEELPTLILNGETAHGGNWIEVVPLDGKATRCVYRVNIRTYPEFRDVDGDGVPEVLLADYLLGSGNTFYFEDDDSRNPRVILRWTGDCYQASAKLMKASPLTWPMNAIKRAPYDKRPTAPPTEADMKDAAAWLRTYRSHLHPREFERETGQWMLNLIYVGRGERAMGFFNDALPAEDAHKADFRQRFFTDLKASAFYDVLREMNGNVLPVAPAVIHDPYSIQDTRSDHLNLWN